MSINQSFQKLVDIYDKKGFIEGVHYRVDEDENYRELSYDNKDKLVTVALLDLKTNEIQKISDSKIEDSFTILENLEKIKSNYLVSVSNNSISYLNKEIEMSENDFRDKMRKLIDIESSYNNLKNTILNPKTQDFIEKDLSIIKKVKSNYLNGYKKQNNNSFYIGSLFKFNYRNNYDEISVKLDEMISNHNFTSEEIQDVDKMVSLLSLNYGKDLYEMNFHNEDIEFNKSTLKKIIKNCLIDRNFIQEKGYSMSEKIEREELNEKPIPKEEDSVVEEKDFKGENIKYINNVDYLVNSIRAESNWSFHKGLDITFRNARNDMRDINRNFVKEGTPIVLLGERVIGSYDKESRKLLNSVSSKNVSNEVNVHLKYLDYKKASNNKKDFENIYDLKMYVKDRFGVDVYSKLVDNPESKSYGNTLLKVGTEIIGETYPNSINIKYTSKLNDIYNAVKQYKEYVNNKEQQKETQPKNLYDVFKPLDDLDKRLKEEQKELEQLSKEIDELDVSLSSNKKEEVKKPSIEDRLKSLDKKQSDTSSLNEVKYQKEDKSNKDNTSKKPSNKQR